MSIEQAGHVSSVHQDRHTALCEKCVARRVKRSKENDENAHEAGEDLPTRAAKPWEW